MMYFCNGKKGLCDHDNECQSTCEFFDGRGGYYAEVVTNADRIRAMSDEELAAWLYKFFWGRCKDITPFNIEKWLRQPVKDGDSDG